MCQGTLGPNKTNGPIARGYAWHTPNNIKVLEILRIRSKEVDNYLYEL